MEIAIGLGIGVALMALLLLIVVKAKNTLVKKQENDLMLLNEKISILTTQKGDADIEKIKTATQAEALKDTILQKNEELERLKEQNQNLTTEREELIKTNSSLKAQTEAQSKMLSDKEEEIERRLNEQQKQFFQQTETLKLQFKELSEQLLKNKVEELGNSNKTNLTPVIDALKEEMKRVGDEIKDSREKSIEQKSSLDTAIRDMMARTNEIGTEATKLAEALKGKSKTQGIYGELILADILTRSGLKEGEQFECQVMLRDEQGNAIVNEETRSKMIPDVVVHYPDKDLIIDSKVSLTAYLEWCNAETDEDRTVAAKRHIISIRNHIKEIVTKSYAAYRKDVKRETIDCVVMFIPNEGALQLMRDIEPSLWYEAYDQKVIITSELSLFSLLKMIENYWAQVIQQRNQDKIIKAAENMLERLASLYEMVDDVEKAFKNVENKFENVKSKMLTGRQSIATSARQVIESGVKSSKIEKRFSDDDTLIIENENN